MSEDDDPVRGVLADRLDDSFNAQVRVYDICTHRERLEGRSYRLDRRRCVSVSGKAIATLDLGSFERSSHALATALAT